MHAANGNEALPLSPSSPPPLLSHTHTHILPPSPPTSLSSSQRGAYIRLRHPLRLSLSATFPSACLRREGRHEPPWPRHREDSWIKYRAELVHDFTQPVNLSVSLSLALSRKFCYSSLLLSTRSLLTAFKLPGWPLWIFHVHPRRGNLTCISLIALRCGQKFRKLLSLAEFQKAVSTRVNIDASNLTR